LILEITLVISRRRDFITLARQRGGGVAARGARAAGRADAAPSVLMLPESHPENEEGRFEWCGQKRRVSGGVRDP
jgi:hypothetical protein